MPRARRPPPPVVVAVAGLTLGVVGCGGDDGATAAERARLADALGFLVTDFDLTDDQVACTGATIEERLDGGDLDGFADAVRRVDEGDLAIADLPEEDAALLTDAIADCVASA